MLRCALWVVVLCLGIGRAEAQDAAHEPTDAELAEARHSFDVATHAFETGDYETAVSEFRAALELSGAADLHFNIYLSEERQGHLPEAADALERYLQHGTVDDEQRSLLTGRLERLRARIAAHTPASAGAEEPETLLASPIAAPAETASASAEEAPDPVPPPVVSTSPSMAGIAMLVVAGVLAANFGVFAGLAVAENDRLGAACGHGCLPGQVATLNTYDIVADVSWIGAAVAGVTGLVLLFALPPDTHTETTRVAVAPWIAPTGAGLSVGGTL
jgi:hypothetical protein